jgi:hypothetical protein
MHDAEDPASTWDIDPAPHRPGGKARAHASTRKPRLGFHEHDLPLDLILGTPSADEGLQICADFYPDEPVPERPTAVLRELFRWHRAALALKLSTRQPMACDGRHMSTSKRGRQGPAANPHNSSMPGDGAMTGATASADERCDTRSHVMSEYVDWRFG